MAFNIIFTALSFSSGPKKSTKNESKSKRGEQPKGNHWKPCVHFILAGRCRCAPGNCRKLLQRQAKHCANPFVLTLACLLCSQPKSYFFFLSPRALCSQFFFFRFLAATVNSQLNYAISYVQQQAPQSMLHYFYLVLTRPSFLPLRSNVLYIFIKPTLPQLPPFCPSCCCLACQGRCLAYCTCLGRRVLGNGLETGWERSPNAIRLNPDTRQLPAGHVHGSNVSY